MFSIFNSTVLRSCLYCLLSTTYFPFPLDYILNVFLVVLFHGLPFVTLSFPHVLCSFPMCFDCALRYLTHSSMGEGDGRHVVVEDRVGGRGVAGAGGSEGREGREGRGQEEPLSMWKQEMKVKLKARWGKDTEDTEEEEEWGVTGVGDVGGVSGGGGVGGGGEGVVSFAGINIPPHQGITNNGCFLPGVYNYGYTVDDIEAMVRE